MIFWRRSGQRTDMAPTVVDQIHLAEVTYDLGCPASVTDLDAAARSVSMGLRQLRYEISVAR
jgi:hypothetical protein